MEPPGPGIFSLHDRPTLDDPPVRPSFSGIVANGLESTQGLADGVTASASDIGGATGAGFENAHAYYLGDTADGLQSESESLASSPTAGDLLDPGRRVDMRAEQVAPYLPDPEAGVQVNLIDPPTPPDPNSYNGYSPDVSPHPPPGQGETS